MRIDALMSSQGGVISRAQVLANKEDDNLIERRLRRREWATCRRADYERDLLAATADELTVRAGWAQLTEPCRFAMVVGRLLQVRGWSGSPRRCPDCADRGDLSA